MGHMRPRCFKCGKIATRTVDTEHVIYHLCDDCNIELNNYDVTLLYRFKIEAKNEEEAEKKAYEKVEESSPIVDVREVD